MSLVSDTHSDFSRFTYDFTELDSQVGIIICGDASVNYHLNRKDYKLKQQLSNLFPNVIFYLVRGNHEARPQSLITMKNIYDKEVEGNVWQEEEFPNIRYLQDGGIYNIQGKRTLVIGGAYSVDKEYRLVNKWQWFATEQLSANEREEITRRVNGEHFDLVLSHTCPYPWMPFDKFLPMIDQSKVDNSMEYWMEDLSHKISYNLWCFGHFHSDRTINYFSEMVSEKIYDLDELFKKHKKLQKRLSK